MQRITICIDVADDVNATSLLEEIVSGLQETYFVNGDCVVGTFLGAELFRNIDGCVDVVKEDAEG